MKQEMPKFNWTFHNLELFYRAVAGCGQACFSFASLLPQVGLLLHSQTFPKQSGKGFEVGSEAGYILSFPGFLGAERSYEMGCDCGRRKETKAERDACKRSAELEHPDQVFH